MKWAVGASYMKNNWFFRTLLSVVLANFVVQVLYVMYQYDGRVSLMGILLMLGVFIWFLIGYILLWKKALAGFLVLLSFLITEFLFYLSTQITQLLSGQGILLHVLRPNDPVLFVVFGIGYINFVAAGFFIFYLIRHKMELGCKR